MFGFKRHVYTCPDIIYLREQRKKAFLVNAIFLALFAMISGVMVKNQEKKMIAEYDEMSTED